MAGPLALTALQIPDQARFLEQIVESSLAAGTAAFHPLQPHYLLVHLEPLGRFRRLSFQVRTTSQGHFPYHIND